MFKTVYLNDYALKEKEKVKDLITHLFYYYMITLTVWMMNLYS